MPHDITAHMDPMMPALSWKKYVQTHPPFSVALDGYVAAGPRLQRSGPRVNFNHHEEVDRAATHATCGQALYAIRTQFFELFRNESGPKAIIYMNDCDQDVCLSYFLLKYFWIAENPNHAALNRLVSVQDTMDAMAGAYPFHKDLRILHEMAWVFEPYTRFRLNGGLDRKQTADYLGVLEDVENRIMQHITGRGKEIAPDYRYERIGGGKSWALVKELGAQAKTGMFSDRLFAYISTRTRPDGRFVYTVGRISPYINFDVPMILKELSQHEKANGEPWGGGNTIGGSPRVHGSALSPDEVQKIVNEAINRTARQN